MRIRISTKIMLIAAAAAFLLSLTSFDFAYSSVNHTVKKGENLAKIAKKHKISSAKIREANDLSSDKLSIGQKLVIPSDKKVRTVRVKSSKRAAEVSKQEEPESAGPAEQTYTVQKKDTLSRIAKKFNTTGSSIRKANGLDSDKLKIGRKLVIPSEKTVVTEISDKKLAVKKQEDSEPAHKEHKTADEQKYTVHKGDSIDKIARKFNTTSEDIREDNHLESDKLAVGRKLLIHPGAKDNASHNSENKTVAKTGEHKTSDYKNTVELETRPLYKYHRLQRGETLASVAKKYGLSVKELKTINDIKKKKKVGPGQNLIVGNISGSEAGKARKIQRVDISKKIEQVKVLAESPELSNMSPTDRLLLFAKKMLDLPYKFGANGVMGVDCSSFVQRVYSFVDMKLPRSAREQFHVGEKISKDELKSGDLLFFRTYARFPSHVGIYLGDNLFIHASSVSKKVQIDSLDKPYYIRRYIGAKRLLTDSASTVEDTAAAIVHDAMNKD
jgi:peptidoglycan DL-endopeptidase LytE